MGYRTTEIVLICLCAVIIVLGAIGYFKSKRKK